MNVMDPSEIEKFKELARETVEKLQQSPDFLKLIEVPDTIRISQQAWDQMNNSTLPPLPFGIKVEVDPDLKDNEFKLGAKPPSEAQPSDSGESDQR